MYLRLGERVTVEELLYGLLLCSGNDAAEALADGCGGTASFVRRMNGLAGELGMEDTSFENPSGLDGQATIPPPGTWLDLAAYAAGNHTFVRLCSTRSVTIGGRTMTNHNRLLRAVPGCIGMKTGYTRAAGRAWSALLNGTAGGWWLSPCRTATTGRIMPPCMTGALPNPPGRRRRPPPGGYAVKERLQKIIAAAGICSRRAAEELLRQAGPGQRTVRRPGRPGGPGVGHRHGGRPAPAAGHPPGVPDVEQAPGLCHHPVR